MTLTDNHNFTEDETINTELVIAAGITNIVEGVTITITSEAAAVVEQEVRLYEG